MSKRDFKWSEAVREEYKGRCPHCGSRLCSSHHIIPRANKALRYVVEDGIYACDELHRLFEKEWRGKEKEENIDYYTEEEGRFKNLMKIMRGIATHNDFGYRVIE